MLLSRSGNAALACALFCLSLGAVSELTAAQAFRDFEQVRTAASKSEKFTLLLCYADVPGDPTTAKAEFEDAIAKNAEIAKLAANLELGSVNCFNMAYAHSNQCIDPKLQRLYGWPVTVALYAPGALRPVWTKTASKDTTASRHRFTHDEIKGYLTEAAKLVSDAEESRKKLLETYGAKKVNAPEITKNGDALMQLSEWYAGQYCSDAAIECIESAMALKKKNTKVAKKEGDEGVPAGELAQELEGMAMACADTAFEGWDWKNAAERYRKFTSSHKDSEQLGTANIQLVLSLAGMEDLKGAIAQCQTILKNKKLAEQHDQARELLSKYEAALKKS